MHISRQSIEPFGYTGMPVINELANSHLARELLKTLEGLMMNSIVRWRRDKAQRKDLSDNMLELTVESIRFILELNGAKEVDGHIFEIIDDDLEVALHFDFAFVVPPTNKSYTRSFQYKYPLIPTEHTVEPKCH